MSDTLRKNLLKYGISSLLCLALAWLYVYLRPEFATESLMEKYRILCDAFTLPGTLCLMVGALLWVTNAGALDGISYAMSMAFRALIPGGRLGKQEKYYDYVERKRQNRIKGYGFLFVVGGVFMVVALVFMFLFHQLYE